MQRLGLNIGGYRGETIDIHRVREQIDKAAAEKNWTRDDDFPALRRPNSAERKRLYISTGTHGDEPAGPLAALRLLQEDQWPENASLWLSPCLNPAGFSLNRRENAAGVDLNRDYRHLETAEVRAHVEWLQRQPQFDLTLCLHEDWEAAGFYVYELNPDNLPSLARIILEAAAKFCPVDMSPLIEGWSAQNGVISPHFNPDERPRWAEALYLITTKTRRNYTMEAPSDYPLAARVDALVAGVRAALAAL